MAAQVYEEEPSCLLGEVGKLISDEARDAIDRMIALATGQLVAESAIRLNTENRTPGTLSALQRSKGEANRGTDPVLPNTDAARTPHSRIYLKTPHLFCIEYIINAALGTPGADIECCETIADASERLQGAKCSELNIDNSDLLYTCDQQIKEALPIAIERLFELAAGITLQRTRYGKPYTITCKPNCRAIEFIAERVAGKSTSVIGELRTRFQTPDAAHIQQASSPLPFMGEGLGVRVIEVGGEGCIAGGEGYNAGGEALLPPYISTANKRLADFLPTAIGHMKSLARGAQVIIEVETEGEFERRVLQHEPDARANAFLINRFMGAPTNYLRVERIVEKTEQQLEIERLSALYPDVIAHYGTAEAAIAAYDAKYGDI